MDVSGCRGDCHKAVAMLVPLLPAQRVGELLTASGGRGEGVSALAASAAVTGAGAGGGACCNGDELSPRKPRRASNRLGEKHAKNCTGVRIVGDAADRAGVSGDSSRDCVRGGVATGSSAQSGPTSVSGSGVTPGKVALTLIGRSAHAPCRALFVTRGVAAPSSTTGVCRTGSLS